MSLVINISFAENDLQLKASYGLHHPISPDLQVLGCYVRHIKDSCTKSFTLKTREIAL